jgi:hypothetical protein
MQEWLDLARDDVSRVRLSPSLVSLLVGWVHGFKKQLFYKKEQKTIHQSCTALPTKAKEKLQTI